MAIMAYSLPLDQIAIAAGVMFLLLFTQVNISVLTIRKIYGDKLDYGFKMPLYPVMPVVVIFLKLGLAIYLLVTQPLSLGISVLWILLGFVVYRLYIFKREIAHYAPLVTSGGGQTRKDFRILIPYTPENPDRLLKYAIRIAKENDGEINILRVITVPMQTPLSAGVAFADTARRVFEPLRTILDKEQVLNHYLVRVSHDATEAILATIEEQKINLLVTDFEALRANKKLQTLVTCNITAIHTTGSEMDQVIEQPQQTALSAEKKNLVVVYDGGDHSDAVLKTTSWLEHSGLFKIYVLAITSKERMLDEEKGLSSETVKEPEAPSRQVIRDLERQEFLANIGIEFNRIILNEQTEKNADESARIIQAAISAAQPDVVVAGASIRRFNVFDSHQFVSVVERLNCPVIIARQFAIPGVNKVRMFLRRLTAK
jgi:nucleotide-binding universal stress UspA family protein